MILCIIICKNTCCVDINASLIHIAIVSGGYDFVPDGTSCIVMPYGLYRLKPDGLWSKSIWIFQSTYDNPMGLGSKSILIVKLKKTGQITLFAKKHSVHNKLIYSMMNKTQAGGV